MHTQLHRLLAGPSVDRNPSFESVVRANDVAKQLMAANIELAKSYDLYRKSVAISSNRQLTASYRDSPELLPASVEYAERLRVRTN